MKGVFIFTDADVVLVSLRQVAGLVGFLSGFFCFFSVSSVFWLLLFGFSSFTLFSYRARTVFHAVLARVYEVLLGFTGFYLVLLGFIGFYWVLLSFTGFHWVLLGFT